MKGLSLVLALVLSLAGAAEVCADPTPWRDVTGILLPEREETLAATVVGRIAAIHFREGAEVGGGEVIIELENERERLEVERRRLAMESRIEEDIARERAALADSESAAARRLFEERRSVSLEEVNKKELESKLARAELAQIGLIKERERIEYAMAQRDLSERKIRAPGNGIVAEVFVEVGEVVEPRQPLARVIDSRACLLEANLPAAWAARLLPGMKIPVEVEGFSSSGHWTGEVSHLAPFVDAASGLRLVRVRIDNADGRLTPGLNGRLRLSLLEAEERP